MSSPRTMDVKIVLFVGLAVLFCGASGARRGLHADSGVKVFDVTQYGAVADGKKNCAQAFIQAWNAACHSKGAAKVVIPAATGAYLSGEVFFAGPCSSAKPLTVEVQATVLAETDLSEYPNGQWFTVQNVDGLQITGGGTFDGQGQTAWKYNSCGHQAICESPLPPSMVFDGVNNSAIQGINLVNSKGTHLNIRGSHNITFQNLNITAAPGSPTEGIHIAQSDLVTISSSAIKAGEGCISKGDGVRDIAISALHCL